MPEGPEIRKAADKIERAIAGQTVAEIFFAFEHLKPYQEKLIGTTVTRIRTYGKAMVTDFDSDWCIYSHNQLYGKWMVRRPYSYPDTNRQLRLAIHTAKKSALLYSASDIEVWPQAEIDTHPFIQKLGLDVLDSAVAAVQIREVALKKTFYRRQFATLMLDQGFLCGIGNYLRSEILFVGGIHPTKRPTDCTDDQLDRWSEAAIALPRQSYAHSGITNDLELVALLKDQGCSRRQYRHWVFGRANQPCYRCGTKIVKASTGGRRIYICPTCQPN
ncbi:MAG: endonuclease VIII [Cyanobacteria bacterium P01_C01_bin.73]